IKFNNQIELIHQVLQSILEIAQVYKAGDFSKAIGSRLQKLKLIPDGLEVPKVHLKASGMRALSSVISSVEKQKESKQLNIAVLKDSYYEIVETLNKGKSHTCVTFDGDVFNKNKAAAMQNLKN